MADFRALKERARRDLHEHLQVPAYYRASPSSAWVAVHVRHHRATQRIGDLPGLEGATMRDLIPRLIFMRDEVAMPARGAIVSIATGEAYSIGDTDPPDGISITAHIAPVPAAQTTGFPVP